MIPMGPPMWTLPSHKSSSRGKVPGWKFCGVCATAEFDQGTATGSSGRKQTNSCTEAKLPLIFCYSLSLSLSINYLHYLYLFNLFLSLCFNHFSVKSSFKSAPQAPGPPGPRRCFRSVSVHLQVLMNLVDIFVPALLRDDRRPGQSSCHVHG